jgi:endonuclease/exonuclease/phosphatase (EEP) superfamily protein YafD
VRCFAWTQQALIVVAALTHQLLWAAPLAVLLFLLVRRWRAVGVAVFVLALAVVSQLPDYLAGNASSGAATTLRVLQANLKVGGADATRVVAAVRDGHVDVAMTEELTSAERDRLLAAGLSELLPYRLDASLPDGGGGLAIWSRFPLTRTHNYPHFTLGVLSARLSFGGRAVTVVAVHLLPPWPDGDDEWLAETHRLQGRLDGLAQEGPPVVVAGDFNATTDNAQFRGLLGRRYSDGADSSGAGYLASYPTDRWFPPVIAIDHVLTSRAVCTSLTDVELPGSDHRALLAAVALPGRH